MAASCKIWQRLSSCILCLRRPLIVTSRGLGNGDKSEDAEKQKFDEKLLEILACPLSKKPLRYDAASNQLICDELGVAYPIINGIPDLIPSDGKIIHPSVNKE